MKLSPYTSQFIYLLHGYYFPEPPIEKTILSLLNYISTAIENYLIIYMRVYLLTLYSIPLTYVSLSLYQKYHVVLFTVASYKLQMQEV